MKWILLTIVVVTSVLADLLQSREMKAAAPAGGKRLGLVPIVRAIVTRPTLILALVSMTVSFFAFLALVQTQPISFAVPASAGTFVVEMALARLILKERVDVPQAAGALLVLGGIVLLGQW